MTDQTPALISSSIFKKSIFALSTLSLAIHAGAVSHSVMVDQSDSGDVSSTGINLPADFASSRYSGERPHMKLMYDWPWNESDPDKEYAGFRPGDYHIYVVNNNGVSQGEIQYSKNRLAKQADTNWDATLERHVPFNVTTSGKQVGLYMGEWGSWERAYPSEMIAANNITHLYYGFVGLCDYERIGANGNTGLDSEFGKNSGNGKTMQAACGQGMAPNYTKTREADLVQLGVTEEKGDFEVSSYDYLAFPHHITAIEKMKQQAPHLKAILSVGGWTLSDPFYDMADSASYRHTFVNSVVGFVKEHRVFDGIDIDWEFPGGRGATAGLSKGYQQDRDNYTALIKELRNALTNNFGSEFELSAALSASPSKLASIDLNALKDDFSYINVMTYDLYGAWGKDPSHHAAAYAKPVAAAYKTGVNEATVDEDGRTILVAGDTTTTADVLRGYSSEGAIEAIRAMYPNFPMEKLNLGVASYSRGWQEITVNSNHDKLFWHGQAQKHSEGYGMAGTYQVGVSDFRDVYDHQMTGNAVNLYYDEQAKAAYTWQESGRRGNTISAQVESFDSPRSVIDKGELMAQVNTEDGQAVAQANLKTDGWGSVAVQKRMVDLLGEPWSNKTSPDSTIFELSEKLF